MQTLLLVKNYIIVWVTQRQKIKGVQIMSQEKTCTKAAPITNNKLTLPKPIKYTSLPLPNFLPWSSHFIKSKPSKSRRELFIPSILLTIRSNLLVWFFWSAQSLGSCGKEKGIHGIPFVKRRLANLHWLQLHPGKARKKCLNGTIPQSPRTRRD